MRRFSFLSRSEMKFLTKTVNILIKIFLIGLLLQFLLQTFFTYKLGFDGAVRNAVWLRKEILILVFLAIILYLLWKKSQEIWFSALWSWLKSQKAFRFLIYFVVLCVITFVLAVLVQRVGIGAYILTVKYDILGFLIFVLGMFLALLLPISTKRNRRYNELLKWVVYGAFVWRAAIAFLPSLLKLFGYTRNSFEGTLSGNPPAVYYTEINQWHARNQFLFERPISFGFFLVAMWPLFALLYLRKLSIKDKLGRTFAFGALAFSTYSRAAMAVWVLQTGVLLLLLYPKHAKKLLLYVALPGVLAFIVAFFTLKSVFFRAHSNTWHLKLLVEGVELGMSKPLSGRGAGYSGPASHQLCLEAQDNPRCDQIRQVNEKYSMQTPGYNPENQYVQIFMEYGLLGLIPWLLCFGRLLRVTLRQIYDYILEFKKGKKSDSKTLTKLLTSIAFGLWLRGLAVEGLVLHSFVDRMIVYPFMLLFGLWRGQQELNSASEENK